MKKNLVFLSLLVLIFVAFSCNKKELFEQPTVEVTGYTLTELPGDSAHIEVNMTLVNNDKRDALVKDAQYIVDIEGFISGTENVTIDKQIFPDTIYEFTLPLTLATEDAIQLLVKMDKGEELSYIATGTFHVEDPYLKGFDWPIDVSGKALVITGFEDYFEQPDVVVDSVEVVYTINGTLPFATSYDFDTEVYCSVTNNDNRKVEIDEVEYIPTIEGKLTDKKLYSDTYPSNLVINPGEKIILVLPVSFTLNPTEGATMLIALSDGTAEYIVEGTFETVKVDDAAAVFKLPLYETGSVPISSIQEAD